MHLDDGPHPFDELVQQPDSKIRLAHAALLWARDEYTAIAPAHYLERLHAVADRVDATSACSGQDRVDALRRVLVESHSFRGNYEDFGNPANSYLNCVIDARRGIPVSLGAIWLDIAQQLDWPIVGVSMPGHFVLRYEGIAQEILIDPFNAGRELTRDDCAQMLAILYGPDFTLTEEHLATVGTHAILARMLGNLYATYVKADDWARTIRVLLRITALRPQDALMQAELGRVQILAGDLKGSANTLNRALELAVDNEETSTIQQHLAELRTRLGEQN